MDPTTVISIGLGGYTAMGAAVGFMFKLIMNRQEKTESAMKAQYDSVKEELVLCESKHEEANCEIRRLDVEMAELKGRNSVTQEIKNLHQTVMEAIAGNNSEG